MKIKDHKHQEERRENISDADQPVELLNDYGHSIGEGKKATEGSYRHRARRAWTQAPKSRSRP